MPRPTKAIIAVALLATAAGMVGNTLRGQTIPLDSLYVLGTQGEEMAPDYTVTLNEGSGLRVWWNMNTASSRDGYSIYCGLRRNNAAYEIMPPQDDRTENPTQQTAYDFACRSCKTNTQSSCFIPANTDYITTYQRSFLAKTPGSTTNASSSSAASSAAPSPTPVTEQSFLVEGIQGERAVNDVLTLRAGSQLRLAWNISTVNTREPHYSIYCSLSKNGGALTPVSGNSDYIEELPSETTYELACRSCNNFLLYQEWLKPDPWDVCWNRIDNTDYIETFRKKYRIIRENYCGDSKLTGAEQCDDGTNTTPGDGCSMSCVIEPGWSCSGQPSKCNICGNGTREGAESCDDGNKNGGDGCSATCETEQGYACAGTTCTYSIACKDGIDNDGDGLIDAQENRASSTHLFGSEAEIRAYLNGISALITPEPLQEREFMCPNYGLIVPDPEAPNGITLADEKYMKNSAADKFCRLFQWDEAVTSSCVPRSFNDLSGIWGEWFGEQMIRMRSMIGNYSYYSAIRCSVNPDCSDGEDNDYDNLKDMQDPDCTNPQDTSELRADNGCTSLTDLTEGTCGDGVQEPAEQCDDRNTRSGDGCSATCKIEVVAQTTNNTQSSAPMPAAMSSASSTIVAAVSSANTIRCGNGILEGNEQCDDRNTQNGDGCSFVCRYEVPTQVQQQPVQQQPSAPAVQQPQQQPASAVCGDAVRQNTEQCDDGNNQSNDGCSSQCRIEDGFICFNTQCAPICGDGKKRGLEQCDDGNQKYGDGCSATCTIENIPSPQQTASSNTVAQQPAPQPNISSAPNQQMQQSSVLFVPPQNTATPQASSQAWDWPSFFPPQQQQASSLMMTSSQENPLREAAPPPPLPFASSAAPTLFAPPSSRAIIPLAAMSSAGMQPVTATTSAAPTVVQQPQLPQPVTAQSSSAGMVLAATSTETSSAPALNAAIIQPLPLAQQFAYVQPQTGQITQHGTPPHTAASGPGALAIMAAGSAIGVGWIRKKRAR